MGEFIPLDVTGRSQSGLVWKMILGLHSFSFPILSYKTIKLENESGKSRLLSNTAEILTTLNDC